MFASALASHGRFIIRRSSSSRPAISNCAAVCSSAVRLSRPELRMKYQSRSVRGGRLLHHSVSRRTPRIVRN
jgi:hypothetical protein